MKLKKIIPFIAATAALGSFTCLSQAKEKVIIPDYECIINNSSVYYKDSLYPLLSYKDVTYFPMTYDYCRSLSLTSSYSESEGLFIAYLPKYPGSLPIYDTALNLSEYEAVIPEYPIYINGRKIDNSKEEYPLLNFRGVTYFPMTWDYAVNEFNWSTEWETGKFSIDASYPNSNLSRITIVDKTEDSVIFGFNEYYTSCDAGGYSTSNPGSMKKLDFKTETLTDLDEYDLSEQYLHSQYFNADVTYDKSTGEVRAFGKLLPEINDFKRFNEEDYIDSGLSISGSGRTVNGVDFLEASERFTAWNEDGSGFGTNLQYLYLLIDETPYFIGNYLIPVNAVKTDHGLYFTVRGYGQTVSRHYLSNTTLYKYSDGKITNITESFPDHNSVSLLGSVGNTLYLKCEWCPRPALSESGYHQVSAINDGYFTFDGEALTKIAPYSYSNFDVLSPEGDIWQVTGYNMTIRKVN